MSDVMSKVASDLLKIAVKIGGFPVDELQRRIMLHPDRRINEATVIRWLDEIAHQPLDLETR